MAIIEDAVARLQMNPAAAGVVALLGLVAALWAASNYVAAFSRALNAVNGTGETRKWWTVLVVRVLLTLVVGALAAVCAVVLATGGTVVRADRARRSGPAVRRSTVWQWLKWPVALALVMVIVALLYWLAPAKRTRFASARRVRCWRWCCGSWLRRGSGCTRGRFGSYDKAYGALAGVIVFLIWLWITNAALLFGSEYNATADSAAGAAGTAQGEASEPSAGEA